MDPTSMTSRSIGLPMCGEPVKASNTRLSMTRGVTTKEFVYFMSYRGQVVQCSVSPPRATEYQQARSTAASLSFNSSVAKEDK